MNRHVCITFAGPIGSGKTPIAYYLSWNLRLPILNNDSMRVETQEDEGELITDVYISKKDKRLKDIIDRKIDFIYDASIDRQWSRIVELVKNNNYELYVISLDFSLKKLEEIYKYKNYDQLDALNKTYQDHQDFLSRYSNEVNLSLTDADFDDRLDKSLQAIKKLLSETEQ